MEKPLFSRFESSYTLKRILFRNEMSQEKHGFNCPVWITIEGDVSYQKVNDAFSELIRHHEILRTSFELFKNEYIQVIHNTLEYKVEDRTKEVFANIEQLKEAYRPSEFQPDELPLFKAGFFKLSDNKHCLAIDKHYILSDTYSDEVLAEDLKNLYSGKSLYSDQPQYVDFALWQNDLVNSDSGEALLQVWSNQFPHNIPASNIPQDYCPNITSSHRMLKKQIPANIIREIGAICKDKNITVQGLLLSSLYLVLYKYGREEDLVIACCFNGRSRKDWKGTAGCFENSVPMRKSVEANALLSDFLKNINDSWNLASKHQEFPVLKITENIQRRSGKDISNLFSVKFEYTETDAHVFKEDQRWNLFHSQELPGGFEDGDLAFRFVEKNNQTELIIGYNSAAFQPATINRLYDYLIEAAIAFCHSGNKQIKDVGIVSAKEKEILLHQFNDTLYEFDNVKPIHQIFEENVAKFSGQPAVIHNNVSLSFDQVNQKANQIAFLLKDIGTRKQEFVGIYMERNLDFLPAMLGIFKSGKAYVPFDIQNPVNRTTKLINNSEAGILISEYQLLKTLPELFESLGNLKHVICLDETDHEKALWESRYNIRIHDRHSFKGKPVVNPENINSNEDWAYMLYTSGSTGDPKGAITRHNGAINHIFAEYKALSLKEGFRFLQSANISSDISVWQFLAPVLKGGAVVIIDKDDLLDYDLLLEIKRTHKVTIAEFVPSFLTGLTAFLKSYPESKLALPDFEWMMIVGEEVPLELVDEWFSLYPETKVLNGYGPCEASDDITQFIMEGPLSDLYKKVPIGKPLANLNIFILDEDLQLLPLGAIGEIGVSGVGVGAGYWNEPEKTSRSFVPNPFQGTLGSTIYRTGDLGRWLADGNLEFLGRIDTQVKIRGFRVEISEIEAVIREFDNILDTVVDLKKDRESNQLLAAYIKVEEKTSESEWNKLVKSLREHLRERLPEYMVPAAFVLMDEFPVNLSDKVDRKALPLPTDKMLKSDGEYVAPRNATEEKLAAIWEQILGKSPVGVFDNFFDMGGHSLKATRMLSYISKELNAKIELRTIFANPTIDLLAKVIDQSEVNTHEEITALSVQELYDVSHAQKRLWILHQLDEGHNAYNIPGSFLLTGSLDRSAFEKAFESLVERHESLRTTFVTINNTPKQKIHSPYDFNFKVDYRDLTNQQKPDGVAKKLAFEETVTAFDLKEDSLLRVKLLKLSENKFVMLFTMHHIISDGWSMEVLSNEVFTLYNSFKKSKENPLKPLRIQYKDFADWQNKAFAKEEFIRHKNYWLGCFTEEVPALELPLDFARPLVKTFAGDLGSITLDEFFTKQVLDLSKKLDASLFMTLLASVKTLLYCYTGAKDITVGSPIAGREHSDLEDQIGFYINTLALRTQFEATDSFATLLNKVKSNTLSAYQHQAYPFDRLVDDLQLVRDMSRSPLFDVMVVLQNTEIEGKKDSVMEGIEMEIYNDDLKTSLFDMIFSFEVSEEKMNVSIQYNTDLFLSDTVKRMLKHFQSLLGQIISNTSKPLPELDYLSPKEKTILLQDFNNTTSEYLGDKTVSELFELQVEAHPNAPALVWDDKTFTYSELNKKANQLATYLRKHYTICPDDKIGVLGEMSEWFVIALLGILKAGAAYVPIDVHTPAERIRHVLEDTCLKVLFVQDEQHKFENVNTISLKTEWEKISDNSDKDSEEKYNAAHLAYVIYTSGSTGKPKGVMIENRSLINLCYWHKKAFGLTETSRATVYAGVGFDASVWEIWPYLISGGCLYLVPEEVKLNLNALVKMLNDKKISHSFLPTAVYEQLDASHELHAGITILTGGDKLRKYHKGSGKLINNYGPTESTVVATSTAISNSISIPIGKPIDNTQIYIVNEAMKLQPQGIAGEICISGDGLARGYLNEENLTEEKFVANPFNQQKRLYKTGDLGKWLSDGNIVFLGRKDSQVKLRGFRIELGEIEKALLETEGVSEAVVLAKGQGHTTFLVAYIVSDSTFDGIPKLKASLGKFLPEYMIPQHILLLEKMPLTLNGKIDRKALPDPEEQMENRSEEYVAPENELEEKLLKLWESVLERNKISIHDNFFELGGNSLKIIMLLNLIHNSFGDVIRVTDLFDKRTIAAQAKLIQSKTGAEVVQEEEFSVLDF